LREWPYFQMFVCAAMLMVLLAPTVSGTMQTAAQACSSLTVQSDKDTYTLGEPVIIAVTFHATLPSCAEPMFVHGYLLTIQVFNATNSEVYSWNQSVPASVNITESWTPTVVGDYSINATSWVTILGNEVMMKGLEASKLIQVQDTKQSATEWFPLAAIAIMAVAGVYLTLRHKRRAIAIDFGPRLANYGNNSSKSDARSEYQI